jgi:hypothetical protein
MSTGKSTVSGGEAAPDYDPDVHEWCHGAWHRVILALSLADLDLTSTGRAGDERRYISRCLGCGSEDRALTTSWEKGHGFRLHCDNWGCDAERIYGALRIDWDGRPLAASVDAAVQETAAMAATDDSGASLSRLAVLAESSPVVKAVDVSKDVSLHIANVSMNIAEIDRTRARAKALGISLEPDSMDEAFTCPLPGHDHDHEACLVWKPGGTYWVVRCGESRKTYGLVEIRAAVAYGAPRRLSAPEASRWLDRLDYEAGLLEPVPVPIAVVVPESQAAREIAGGIQLYLGLRAARGGFPPTEPYTFARRFAMAWCGLTNAQAMHGTGELIQGGFMEWTGEKIGRAKVWRQRAVSKQCEIRLEEAA